MVPLPPPNAPSAPPNRARIQELTAQIDDLNDDLIAATELEDMKRILAQQRALQSQRSVLTGPYQFRKEQLEAALQRIETRANGGSGSISSIVFSGHSGGQGFHGHLGGIEADDVDAAFRGHEELRRGVRGVCLWGCYTGSLGVVLNWRSIFPNTHALLGFAGVAPGDAGGASARVLRESLRLEGEASSVADLDAAADLLDDYGAGRTVLVAAFGNCFVGTSKSKISPMMLGGEAQSADCEEGLRQIRVEYESIWRPFSCACDLRESGAAMSAPGNAFANPHAPASAAQLRIFYARLQRYSTCTSGDFSWILRAVKPENVATMIHFDEVYRNFGLHFCGPVAEVNAILPESARFPDMSAGTWSRRQALERIIAMERYLRDVEGGRVASPTAADLRRVESFAKYARAMLGNLEPACIPPSWLVQPDVEGSCTAGARRGDGRSRLVDLPACSY